MFISKYRRENNEKPDAASLLPSTRHCQNCACATTGRGAARDVLRVTAAAAARTRQPMSVPPRKAGKQSATRPPTCPPGLAALLAERRRGAPERPARVSESRGAGAAGREQEPPQARAARLQGADESPPRRPSCRGEERAVLRRSRRGRRAGRGNPGGASPRSMEGDER